MGGDLCFRGLRETSMRWPSSLSLAGLSERSERRVRFDAGMMAGVTKRRGRDSMNVVQIDSRINFGAPRRCR